MLEDGSYGLRAMWSLLSVSDVWGNAALQRLCSGLREIPVMNHASNYVEMVHVSWRCVECSRMFGWSCKHRSAPSSVLLTKICLVAKNLDNLHIAEAEVDVEAEADADADVASMPN